MDGQRRGTTTGTATKWLAKEERERKKKERSTKEKAVKERKENKTKEKPETKLGSKRQRKQKKQNRFDSRKCKGKKMLSFLNCVKPLCKETKETL